jgi:hypothetical protein
MIHERDDLLYKEVHLAEGDVTHDANLQTDYVNGLEDIINAKAEANQGPEDRKWATCSEAHESKSGPFQLFPLYIGTVLENK